MLSRSLIAARHAASRATTYPTTLPLLVNAPSPHRLHLRVVPPFIAISGISGSSDADKGTTLYHRFPKTLASGPPPSGPFEIDLTALRHEFLRLQATHHPDKQPSDQKAAAEATSSDINHAYRTLADPLLRAQYLLRLRGIDVTDDRNNADDDVDLMEVALEAYEAVEAATEPAHLEAVRTENDRRLSNCERDLQTAFANDDAIAAKRLAVRLLYWVRIREKIEAWEPEALS